MDPALRESDVREEIGRLMAEYGDGILRQCLLVESVTFCGETMTVET